MAPPTQPPFNETAWHTRWHNADVYLRDLKSCLQEIFSADDAYWSSLSARVKEAIAQNRTGTDSRTKADFDAAVGARNGFLKDGKGYLDSRYKDGKRGSRDFEDAYKRAAFLKGLVGMLGGGGGGGGGDGKGKGGGTRAGGSVMPSKIDNQRVSKAPPSNAGGSVMPSKIDNQQRSSKAPSVASGSVMPRVDNTSRPGRSSALIQRPSTAARAMSASSFNTNMSMGPFPYIPRDPGPFGRSQGLQRITEQHMITGMDPLLGFNGVNVSGAQVQYQNGSTVQWTEQVHREKRQYAWVENGSTPAANPPAAQ